MSGQEFLHSPSQHSLTLQPPLRLPLPLPLPLPLHSQPQPQPRLHPLHPMGSFSEGGAVAVQNCKMFVVRGGGCTFCP